MVEPTDRIGQRFGDYWLRRRLGGGAFGNVYLGEHTHDQSLAAVKAMHMRLTRSEELRAFINEVRTFRLQHPHIVRVLDVGIAPDETPFLVMEYASDGTLRDRHPKESRLPLATILSFVTPIASALQYAHDRQVIHRDVKPENMLLGPDGQVWLSDFGIATVAHSTHSLTTESMGGTLPYMAPEQIQGRPRPQSDQYALAIVVYEWLTGTRPFHGTPIEIAMQHQMTPPPALRTSVPELLPELEQIVLTALSKEPKDRFGNVQAFSTALTQVAQAPLEQSMPSETSQEATSTIKPTWSGATFQAEQQQASVLDLKGSQITDSFSSSNTEDPVTKISHNPSSVSSDSVTSSMTPLSSFSLSSSLQPTNPPQSPTIHPPPPSPTETKWPRSPAFTVLVILMTLILLSGGSIGVYGAATGNWPWSRNPSPRNPSHGITTGGVQVNIPSRTWHAQTSGTSQTLHGVTWSGSQFVAVVGDGHRIRRPYLARWARLDVDSPGLRRLPSPLRCSLVGVAVCSCGVERHGCGV